MSGLPSNQSSTSCRQPLNFDVAEKTGRQVHRARQILAYGGLDGVMSRPLMHESGLYPYFAKKARGYEIIDSNGAAYVDWVSGWGSIVLGHCHPVIRDAIFKQADIATSTALMHPLEVEVAESIIEMVPCAEMVAFGKNGSDSLTAAIRVSRASTGRELILQYGFHGFHDWFTCLNPNVKGILPVLRDYTKKFPYNDLDALEALFREHQGQVAGIVMEPVNMYLPEEGYLKAVKQLAHDHGAVLIWDEVVTAIPVGPVAERRSTLASSLTLRYWARPWPMACRYQPFAVEQI